MAIIQVASNDPANVRSLFGHAPRSDIFFAPLAPGLVPQPVNVDGVTFTTRPGDSAELCPWRPLAAYYAALEAYPRGDLPEPGSEALARRMAAFERDLISVPTMSGESDTAKRVAACGAFDLAASLGILGLPEVDKAVGDHFQTEAAAQDHSPRMAWDERGKALDRDHIAAKEAAYRAATAKRQAAEREAKENEPVSIAPVCLGLGILVAVEPSLVALSDADGKQRQLMGIDSSSFLCRMGDGRELHAIRTGGRTPDPLKRPKLLQGFELISADEPVSVPRRIAQGALANRTTGYAWLQYTRDQSLGSGGPIRPEDTFDLSSYEGVKRYVRGQRIMREMGRTDLDTLASALCRGLMLSPELVASMFVAEPTWHTADMHKTERITGPMDSFGHQPTVGGPQEVAERLNANLRRDYERATAEVLATCRAASKAEGKFSGADMHRPGELDFEHVFGLPSEDQAARVLAQGGSGNRFVSAVLKAVGGASEVRTSNLYDALSALGIAVQGNADKAGVSEALEIIGYVQRTEADEAGRRGRVWRKADEVQGVL